MAASTLSATPSNDVTIIDIDSQALRNLGSKLDVKTIQGNAASPAVLAQAGAADADLILALTRHDETNMVACRIASALFNTPNRIARVRYSEFAEFDTGHEEYASSLDLFDINESISPEQLITEQIISLLQHSSALQILRFADDKVSMVVMRAQKGGWLVGNQLSDIHQHLPDDVDGRICAVYRQNRLIVPTASTVLLEDDEAFMMAPTADIDTVMRELRPNVRPARRIMIAGGGNIGYRVAKQLENQFDIKIIEKNPQRAEWLAEHLNNALVLSGSATDESLLENEYIDETHVFCALTNDDEDNIMFGMLAKNLGANRVMAIVNRSRYVDLLEGKAIDIVISPHLITIGSILAHVRLGDVVAVYPLRRGAAEAIEVVIHGDKHTSKMVGRSLQQVKLPDGCYIAAVVRQDTVIMGQYDLILADGDHIIFFVARRRVVPELEKLIQVKLGFFG